MPRRRRPIRSILLGSLDRRAVATRSPLAAILDLVGAGLDPLGDAGGGCSPAERSSPARAEPAAGRVDDGDDAVGRPLRSQARPRPCSECPPVPKSSQPLGFVTCSVTLPPPLDFPAGSCSRAQARARSRCVLPAREVADTIGRDRRAAFAAWTPLIDQIVVVDAASRGRHRRDRRRGWRRGAPGVGAAAGVRPRARQGRRDVARARGRARRPRGLPRLRHARLLARTSPPACSGR